MKTTHQIVLTEDYIAEAQRLSIAQNKMLKFIYQNGWARWLSRLVMVGIIVYSIFNDSGSTAALFGALLAISIWAEWFGRRSLAKARRNVRAKGSTSVVSISENGFDIDGALGNSHLKWAAMLQPVVYPQGVLVRFSRLTAMWLPDLALIEGSPSDVRQLIAQYVDKSKADGK